MPLFFGSSSGSPNARRAFIFAGSGVLLALIVAGAFYLGAPRVLVTSAPTPACGPSTLTIDSAAFRIEPMDLPRDGSLTPPSDEPGVAYWIQGTTTNYVFVVSPAAENLSSEKSLLTSVEGKAVSIKWADCNSTNYIISSVSESSLSAGTLPDQSSAGITIFFEKNRAGAASVVRGELTGQEIRSIDTPMPGASSVQAEISMPETTTSPDGKTISATLSIRNAGQRAFALTASDVSLVSEDGSAAAPTASEPAMPIKIKPGQTQVVKFAFPRPSSSTATLKVFDVEYDIEGY